MIESSKSTSIRCLVLVAAVWALLFPAGCSKKEEQAKVIKQGQEHPTEHPQGHQQSAVSKDDLADAIANYVKRESALKGGFFLVYDKDTNRTLALTLDRVHRERLAKVADGTYFACADFKTQEGKTYDLDIFMKGPSKDQLEVTEISIHKEDGKERYNWVETNGIWSKVPLK
jgi:hypothetical protein